jgi:hypothetical protein
VKGSLSNRLSLVMFTELAGVSLIGEVGKKNGGLDPMLELDEGEGGMVEVGWAVDLRRRELGLLGTFEVEEDDGAGFVLKSKEILRDSFIGWGGGELESLVLLVLLFGLRA